MNIFAVCVVKNESDIIEECLHAASQWADRIFVYDNGSSDGTWEIVQALQSEIIVPWKQDNKVFQESLRAELFNAFRHEAVDGDWWCRLDADEFYVESPRSFLARVPAWQHVVWGIAIEYYLTQDNIDHLDFNVPMRDLLKSLRHYCAENSEPRFFKHRSRLIWNENDGWPLHMGIPAKARALYRHYKYRSPKQMQLRINTRLESQQQGFVVRPHYVAKHWKEEISDAADLDFDQQDGRFRLREDRLPRHLDTLLRAFAKRVMHGLELWP